MKYYILFFCNLLVFCTYCQDQIGTYSSDFLSKEFYIAVSQDKRDTTDFTYYIECESNDKLAANVSLRLNGDKIPKFIEFLNNIKAIYSQWIITANSNSISDLKKDIDVKPFKCKAAFKYGDWQFDDLVRVRARVLFFDDKRLLIIDSDRLQANYNQYIKHDGFQLVFSSSDEIDEFTESIGLENAKAFFRAKNKSNNLFK